MNTAPKVADLVCALDGCHKCALSDPCFGAIWGLLVYHHTWESLDQAPCQESPSRKTLWGSDASDPPLGPGSLVVPWELSWEPTEDDGSQTGGTEHFTCLRNKSCKFTSLFVLSTVCIGTLGLALNEIHSISQYPRLSHIISTAI
ncbi:UNVERIFIED_CONTAM: hypothetical protein K2H54_059426 [Gekko kuhli]